MPFDTFALEEIQSAFSEEVALHSGNVSDTFADRQRLFIRAVFPARADVVPGDSVKAGIALRATRQDVSSHPYVFRIVCSNGAVREHATQTRRLESPEERSMIEIIAELRDAVTECCTRDAFTAGMKEMRLGRESPIDSALTMSALMSRLGNSLSSHLLPLILDQLRERDKTSYDLMNTVT